MQISDVRAYEGKEPFIFISYAHKDSERVLPILAQLQRRGYRVWYDEGIAPGSEWPENIAQHLNDCAVTIAFVSNHSMASPNCRREITYALSKKKPFLGIFLEEAEMSPGMELQMSAQQCVMRYSYRSEDMFYDKVCSCPDLIPCQKRDTIAPIPAVTPTNPPVAKATVPAQKHLLQEKPWLLAVAGGALIALILAIVLIAGGSKPSDPNGTDNKNLGVNTSGTTSQATQTPGDSQPEETTPSQSTQPQQTVPSTALPEGTEPSEPTQTTTPTEPEDDDSPTITLYPDKVVDRDTDYLYLYNKTITADTIRKINQLHSLETLDLKGCTLEPNILDKLEGGNHISNLSLTDCSGINSYRFLEKFSVLWELTLNNCGVTDANLPQLNAYELTYLDLSNNREFTDLSKLSQLTQLYILSIAGTGVTTLNGFPIEGLYAIDFSYTAVNNISRLADCVELSKVYGIETSVNDISPLAKLEELRVLAFSGSLLNNVTTPFHSFFLQELHLSNCGLKDISGLVHLTRLQTVDLSNNDLADVSFVQKSCDTLQYLKINNLPLTVGTDYGFLAACYNLEALYIDYLPVGNLDFCSELTSLVELHASNCNLEDISGLESCTGLKYIYLAKNQIKDVSALAYLEEDYVTLDLAYNELTSVSALSDISYKTLCLVNNHQLDLTTVTVSGNTLLINYVSNLETNLADQFYYYGFLACPLDKVATLMDTYGNYNVTILEDMNAFLAMAQECGIYYL